MIAPDELPIGCLGAIGGVLTGFGLALLARRETRRLYRGRDRRLPVVPSWPGPVAGGFAGAAVGIVGFGWDLAIGVAGVAAALAVVAAVDGRRRIVPNAAVLALAAQGAWDAVAAGGLSGLLEAAIAAAAAVACLALPAIAAWWTGRRFGIGIGDLKLVASLGLWLGALAFETIVVSFAVALGMAALRRLSDGHPLDRPLPYGPAIAAATVIVVAIRLGSLA